MNRFKGSKNLDFNAYSTLLPLFWHNKNFARLCLYWIRTSCFRQKHLSWKKSKKTVTERRMKRRTDTPFYRTLLDDYFCRLRRLNIAFNNKFYGMLNLKNIFRNVDFTKVYWIQIYRLIESKVVSIISLHLTKVFSRMAK